MVKDNDYYNDDNDSGDGDDGDKNNENVDHDDDDITFFDITTFLKSQKIK